MANIRLIQGQTLSIAKALPLQIHPNKNLSAQLHAKDSEKFTDDNHKPEIAIALGPFEVFAGFKPNNEMEQLFDTLEPLKRFLPIIHLERNNELVKTVSKDLLSASDKTTSETQEALRKLPKKAFRKQAYIVDILPRLQE